MSHYHCFEVEPDQITEALEIGNLNAEDVAALKALGIDIEEGFEVEIEASISGDYYPATLESPAEYPEVEILKAQINGKEIPSELEENVVSLGGGYEAIEEEVMEAAEENAEADYGDYLADCYEDRYEDDICDMYYDPY